jgi:hypothetical protein
MSNGGDAADEVGEGGIRIGGSDLFPKNEGRRSKL